MTSPDNQRALEPWPILCIWKTCVWAYRDFIELGNKNKLYGCVRSNIRTVPASKVGTGTTWATLMMWRAIRMEELTLAAKVTEKWHICNILSQNHKLINGSTLKDTCFWWVSLKNRKNGNDNKLSKNFKPTWIWLSGVTTAIELGKEVFLTQIQSWEFVNGGRGKAIRMEFTLYFMVSTRNC